MSRQNDPARTAWAGFAFETVCLKHVRALKAALGIAMVETSDGPWRYKPTEESSLPGVQIDLLLDRRDASINLCEMKFSQSEFTIDATYAKELRQKITVFREVTGTKKNIFLTMVTTYGITDNTWSQELHPGNLTLDALF